MLITLINYIIYIQVEFDTTMAIYGVQTKGRQDYPQWITSYKVMYAETMDMWETYQEPYGTDKVGHIS